MGLHALCLLKRHLTEGKRRKVKRRFDPFFFPDGREVHYKRDDIPELDLAYAITIHKSQGSEFEVVIMPVLTQHFKMLFRNLIYTGLTRAKDLAVMVGTRKALAMAVKNQDTSQRQTTLKELLQS
jgi:exodeoxyribonuclease V alpha subunit